LKLVDDCEIKEIYRYETFGYVNDLKVDINNEDDNYFYVGTNDHFIGEKLNLKRCDKYYYEGKISKDKVIKRIEKTQIY